MSILDEENIGKNGGDNGEQINWDPTDGWHEAVVAAVADLGKFPNKFQAGKMQSKIGVYYILDEQVTIEGNVIQKGQVERYTASLHEKSNLVKAIVTPAELEGVVKITDLVGKRLRLKTKKEGTYINIKLADASDTACPALDNLKDAYVPQFWKVNKDGTILNTVIRAMPGVIDGIRPKSDGTVNDVAPVANQPASVDLAQDLVMAPAATDNSDDIYA